MKTGDGAWRVTFMKYFLTDWALLWDPILVKALFKDFGIQDWKFWMPITSGSSSVERIKHLLHNANFLFNFPHSIIISLTLKWASLPYHHIKIQRKPFSTTFRVLFSELKHWCINFNTKNPPIKINEKEYPQKNRFNLICIEAET